MKLSSSRRTRMIAAIAAPVLAISLASCAGDTDTGEPGGEGGAPIDKITVAVAGVPDLSQLVVLRWQAQLEADGVTVELAQMEASDVALRVVIAGQADMYTGSFAPLIRAIGETGAELKTVVVDSQATNYVFSSKPELTDISELEGATVGINKTGDATESVVRATMTEAGLDPETVNFVQIGAGSARVAALISGQVDMAPVSIDQSIVLESEGFPALVTAADYLTDFMQNGLTTSQAYIDENPEAVQYLVDTYIDAHRWAVTNRDGWMELSREVDDSLNDADRETTYERLVDIGIFAVDGGLQADKLANYMRVARSNGLLTDDAPEPDVWADPTFVEDYLARNGEFSG